MLSKGFTLTEVMISLLILTLSLIVITKAQTKAVKTVNQAYTTIIKTMHANSKSLIDKLGSSNEKN